MGPGSSGARRGSRLCMLLQPQLVDLLRRDLHAEAYLAGSPERISVCVEVLLCQFVDELVCVFGCNIHNSPADVGEAPGVCGVHDVERHARIAADVPFCRPSALLTKMCSPSLSTPTWVTCGEPSGISVASWQ